MENLLPIILIIISVFLIASVLFQQRGSAIGSAFGGSEGGSYSSQRGLQNKLFWATIIFGSLFIIFALLNLVF